MKLKLPLIGGESPDLQFGYFKLPVFAKFIGVTGTSFGLTITMRFDYEDLTGLIYYFYTVIYSPLPDSTKGSVFNR